MCLIANFGFLLPSFCRGRQTLVAFFRNTEYGSGRCFPKRKSECVIRRREIDTGQARTPPVLQGIKEETMILSCIYSLILSKVIGHILLPDLIIGAMRLTAPMTPQILFFVEVITFSCYCWPSQEWSMFSKYGVIVAVDTIKGRGIE